MPQSTADQGANRASSAAPSPSQSSADPAFAASGDVLLAPSTSTDSLDSGNSNDTNATAEHASAAAPVIIADADGPDVPAALAETNAGSDGDFHFAVSTDTFLFQLDNDGSASLVSAAAGFSEDQTPLEAASVDVGGASGLSPTKLV